MVPGSNFPLPAQVPVTLGHQLLARVPGTPPSVHCLLASSPWYTYRASQKKKCDVRICPQIQVFINHAVSAVCIGRLGQGAVSPSHCLLVLSTNAHCRKFRLYEVLNLWTQPNTSPYFSPKYCFLNNFSFSLKTYICQTIPCFPSAYRVSQKRGIKAMILASVVGPVDAIGCIVGKQKTIPIVPRHTL